MDNQIEEIESALYTDRDGVSIGLEEVQLFDDPPLERIPTLACALKHSDNSVRFRAALVLASWGQDEGIDAIENLIDSRIDKHVDVEHRLFGYNNALDELAYAVELYGDTGKRRETIVNVFRKLLCLYGECQFESKLKHALLRSGCAELQPDLVKAMESASANGMNYMARLCLKTSTGR